MKLFWAIFSIYILALSTVPCGDEKDCNEFAETHASFTADNTHNSSHQDEICSPFCICACCGCQGYNIESATTVAVLNTPQDNKIIPYQSEFLSQFSANIWQPPKVS